jgi:ATP-dependent RNA helicase DDX60
MSFVPAPQASAANAASSSANNAPVNSSTGAAPAAEGEADKDLLFKLRTFDVYWVEKSALMYRDGFDKVSTRNEGSWGRPFRVPD